MFNQVWGNSQETRGEVKYKWKLLKRMAMIWSRHLHTTKSLLKHVKRKTSTWTQDINTNIKQSVFSFFQLRGENRLVHFSTCLWVSHRLENLLKMGKGVASQGYVVQWLCCLQRGITFASVPIAVGLAIAEISLQSTSWRLDDWASCRPEEHSGKSILLLLVYHSGDIAEHCLKTSWDFATAKSESVPRIFCEQAAHMLNQALSAKLNANILACTFECLTRLGKGCMQTRLFWKCLLPLHPART